MESENSENEEEKNDDGNVKKYEIVGFNKKPKRMSIIDILKKRNIDIISEKPFKTSTFLDKVKNSKKKKEFNNPKLNLIEERPEIQETDEGVKYLIFTSSVTIKKKKKDKWRPREFILSKEANINLKGFRQLMSEERERERLRELENKEKKNDNKKVIENYKKRKVNSNYIVKNKNNLNITQTNKMKLQLDKAKTKDNLNKSSSLITKNMKNQKKKVNNNNNKVSFNMDKNSQNKKNNIRGKLILENPILRKKSDSESSEEEEEEEEDENNNENNPNNNQNNINKLGNALVSNKSNNYKRYDDGDNRAIKPPIFTRYHSSSEDEEGEEEEEEKEEKQIQSFPMPQEEVKTRKPNRFDELLHAYGTNYDYENKNMKSKDKNQNKVIKIEQQKIARNNAMKNAINSKNIYTDKETNQIRRDFKRKLTHNEYRNDEENEEYDPKNIHKVKGNKAKIKKFKTKNEYDNELSNNKTVNTGNIRPKGNKAKIKKLHNNVRNILPDYEYSNIVLQNSTYNQTTYNYYTNETNKSGNKLKSNKTINTSSRKTNSNERNNKSVGHKNKGNKSKIKSALRY